MTKPIVVLLATGLLASFSLAQKEVLYTSDKTIAEQGVAVRGWGGGAISETDELKDQEKPIDHIVRVGTLNYNQGGIVRFAKPANMSSAFGVKDNLLRVTMQFPASVLQRKVKKPKQDDTPGKGGQPGLGGAGGAGDGGGDAPGKGGGGAPGGPPGFNVPGKGGSQGGDSVPGRPGMELVDQTDFPTSIRMIVTTTDGLKSEGYVTLEKSQTANESWFTIGMPLQAISGFDRTNKEVLSVALSADAPATFFVKSIDVNNDKTPLFCEMNTKDDLNLAFGDEFTFIGTGYGGSSNLIYHWNFDSEHGDAVDAEGRVIKRKFRKAGTFVVKLTVLDKFGLKAPFSTTVKVTVNP